MRAAHRKRRRRRFCRPRLESLEPRLMLALTVPPTVDPGLADQVLLPPGASILDIGKNPGGPASRLYQFSLDRMGLSDTVVQAVPSLGCSHFQQPCLNNDVAVAVYDVDGNLVAKADTDSPFGPGLEKLSLDLASQRAYVLGVFFSPSGPVFPYQLEIDAGPQQLKTSLAADPATGLDGVVGLFDGSADVDYYPVDLTSVGANARLNIESLTSGMNITAALMRRDGLGQSWQVVAQQSGENFTIHATPEPERHLTDSQWMVALSSDGLAGPAGSYSVELVVDLPLLAPTSVNPDQATVLLLPPLSNHQAAGTQLQKAVAAGDATTFQVYAPFGGTATFQLSSSTLQPQLAFYSADGSQLHSVHTLSISETLDVQVPVIAGQHLLVRISDVLSDQTGQLQFSVQVPYVAPPKVLGTAPLVLTQNGLLVGPDNGGSYFEITPDVTSDLLMFRIAPQSPAAVDPVAPQVWLSDSAGQSWQSPLQTAGQTVEWVVDISQAAGPLHVYLASDIGSDPVQLKLAQIDIPKTIPLQDLAGVKTDLEGDINQSSSDPVTAAAIVQPAGALGNVSGLGFYQLLTPLAQTSQVTLTASGGAVPLLAHYELQQGLLRLKDYQFSIDTNQVQLNQPLAGERYRAVVGVNLALAGGGTFEYSVDGPSPEGVGIRMVPKLEVPFGFEFNTHEVSLDEAFQQHLWTTRLPFNMTDLPVVKLSPVEPGDSLLEARLSIFREDNSLIVSRINSAPGAELYFDFAELCDSPACETDLRAELSDQLLKFRVEVAGIHDDGTYELGMTVDTGNPFFFEVQESAWRLSKNSPTADQIIAQHSSFAGCGFSELAKKGIPVPSCVGLLPENEPVVDVIQNAFGDGQVDGEFTSSQPYFLSFPDPTLGNPGSIDVYRFWALQDGPVTVRTVPIDATVNTSLRVYRAFFENGEPSFLGQLELPLGKDGATQPEIEPHSVDWFQTERSVIDAQTHVQNFRLLDYPPDENSGPLEAGGMYYVVVKNEQGTQGKYRLVVEAADMPAVGDYSAVTASVKCDEWCRANKAPTTYLPVHGGQTELALPYVASFIDFVGYYPIQVPQFHNGMLSVSSPFVPPFAGTWQFDLFDAEGQPIAGTTTNPSSQAGIATVSNFSIPAGTQTVYLRVQDLGHKPANLAKIFVSATVNPPHGATPPPETRSIPTQSQMLPANPFGDTAAHADALTVAGSTRIYGFQAPAGRLNVQLEPQNMGDVALQWSLYTRDATNGNLRLLGWNVPLSSNGQWIPHRLSSNFMLPNPRSLHDSNVEILDPYSAAGITLPSEASRVSDHDTTDYHDLYLIVTANTNAQSSGAFTIHVESDAELPLQDDQLVISPLTGHGAEIEVQGNDWFRLWIPEGTTGVTTLTARKKAVDLGFTTIQYDVYSADGQPMVSGSKNTGFPAAPVSIPLALQDGKSYLVRMGLPSQSDQVVRVEAQVALSKAGPQQSKPPAVKNNVFSQPLNLPSVDPDGNFWMHPLITPVPDPNDATLLASYAVWVEGGGVAEFNATLDASAAQYWLAVYRGVFENCPNEFDCGPNHSTLHLVDYVNAANVQLQNNQKLLQLETYLEPGMYAVQLVRQQGGGDFAFDFQLPAYEPRPVFLDPNQGSSDTPALRIVNQVPAATEGPIFAYHSTFYRVQAPAGSQAGIDAVAQALTGEAAPFDGRGVASIWKTSETTNQFQRCLDLLLPMECPLSLNPAADPNEPNPKVTAKDGPAKPLQDFWISFQRENLLNVNTVAATFVVPMSGTPDLAISVFEMLPDNGTTSVEITVINLGYARSIDTKALYSIQDFSKFPPDLIQSLKNEYALPPFGSRARQITWDPLTPQDTVYYKTDYDPVDPLGNGKMNEPDEANNERQRVLSEVDPAYPVITKFALSDPLMDGNTNPLVWGRYVSTIPGAESQVLVNVADASNDLYQTIVELPKYGVNWTANGWSSVQLAPQVEWGGLEQNLPAFGNAAQHTLPFSFFRLLPTGTYVPNKVKVRALDAYGLESTQLIRTVQVVAPPDWLKPANASDPTSIVFNPAARQYEIHFDKQPVDFNEKLSTTVQNAGGSSIPVIGNRRNKFRMQVVSNPVASLNPDIDLTPLVAGQMKLEVIGFEVLDQSFVGSGQVSDKVFINSLMQIDGKSLEIDQLNVGFEFRDLDVYNYTSPEIPLFTYGVPGVANVNANLTFGIDVTLDAAITLALKPAVNSGKLGLTAPMYIEPSIKTSATVTGEVEVLGVDIASLSGGVSFTLAAALGLDAGPNQVVSFQDYFNNFATHNCVGLSGKVNIEFAADVLGIEIWDFEPPLFSFSTDNCNNGGIVKLPGEGETSSFESFLKGDSAIQQLTLRAHPQLAIDPNSNDALYLQLVDADPDAAQTRGNLAFARRSGSQWTALDQTTLAGMQHVSHPALALTHDAIGATAAVVVYQALAQPQVGVTTLNQFLSGQELRSRYFDGTQWLPEQLLTTDSAVDLDPTVAFNQSGDGVMAWTRNASGKLVGDDGQPNAGKYAKDANEIWVAVWDAATHQWTAPVALTSNNVRDSKPTVVAAPDGSLHVLWIQDQGTHDRVMSSSLGPQGWSTPAEFKPAEFKPAEFKPTRIKSVVAAADSAGKLHVLMHQLEIGVGEQPADSRLLAVTAPTSDLGAAGAARQVASGANYSRLRAVADAVDNPVVYWEQSNGAVDGVFMTQLAAQDDWMPPRPVTNHPDLEVYPSLALDSEGMMQVVYEKRIAAGAVSGGAAPDRSFDVPSQGDVGTSSVVSLPEFMWTRELDFVFDKQAASGQTAVGQATLTNHGLAGGKVELQYFVGLPARNNAPFAQETIQLSPGSQYVARQPFPIQRGLQTYCILIEPGSEELLAVQQNLTCGRMEGLPDLIVEWVQVSTLDPVEGETIQIKTRVTNRSDQPVRAFDVAFMDADPRTVDASFPAVLIDRQTVDGLAAGESVELMAPWTIPGVDTNYLLTVIADAGQAIDEAGEKNNYGHQILSVHADPALVPVCDRTRACRDAVTATVVNSSGVDNVLVNVLVSNVGQVDLSQVGVRLDWIPDDAVQTVPPPLFQTIAQLGAGDHQKVTFVTSGWAGRNSYRVRVDPQQLQPDRSPSNNVEDVFVELQGFADLTVDPAIVLNPASPVQKAPLSIQTVVHNQGIASADQVRVDVYARPGAGLPSSLAPGRLGRWVGGTIIDHLDPLATSGPLTIDVDTTHLAGRQTLCVVADVFDRVLETSDANNASCTATIDFAPGPNGGPTIVGPDPLAVDEDHSLKVSGLFVSDPDALQATVRLTLQTSHGGTTVRTDVAGGIGARQVTGNGTAKTTIEATLSQINATLTANGGVVYQPVVDYFGPDSLVATIDDRGHQGTGGAKVDSWSVPITVQPVNDPPRLRQPADDVTTVPFDLLRWSIPSDMFEDPDGDKLSYRWETADGKPLPKWLQFNQQQARLEGEPMPEHLGAWPMVLIASDPSNEQASDQFVIHVQASDTPWRNPRLAADIDFDGRVIPRDVLILIIVIARFGSGPLPPVNDSVGPPPFLDPTGDNWLTPRDVLFVINYLNGRGGGEGEVRRPDPPPAMPVAVVADAHRDDSDAETRPTSASAALSSANARPLMAWSTGNPAEGDPRPLTRSHSNRAQRIDELFAHLETWWSPRK